MSAFEFGIVLGMIALVYITYEVIKYEPFEGK